jgi:hypothetical protein
MVWRSQNRWLDLWWRGVALTLVGFSPVLGASAQSSGSIPDGLACKTTAECAPPLPRRGEDPRCLESVCHKGRCSIRVRAGHTVEGTAVVGEFSCFSAPLVCSATAKVVADTDRSKLIAIRDGEYCLPPITSTNPCLKPVCRETLCVHEADDDAACPEVAIAVSPCETRGCRNGTCQPVPDPRKRGVSCRESETAECRTTSYTCSETGHCEARKDIAENAECAANPLALGASQRLPATFKELLLTSATFPHYSCDVARCKLEFCGDGVINGSEECDGTILPPKATVGRRCNSSCTLE